ncbi:MAG: hypothetical protein M3R21_09945 [Candidatus Dormibacteraeota bacterium]|nr:hypothetical protein [Candidatus Dormibacteraeota bacterium]
METADMQARLLGSFRESIGDRVVDRWERPSARLLLQFLLLDPLDPSPGTN